MNENLWGVSNASDMNNQGNVTGYRNGYDAFLWTSSGIQDIGITQGYEDFMPKYLNDQNQIVGTCDQISTERRPSFFWDNGSFTILDEIPFHPIALNNSGIIAGSYPDPYSYGYRMCLWDSGQFIELGKGEIEDINDQGMILAKSDDYPVDYPPYQDDVCHVIHGAERFDIRQLAGLPTDTNLELRCINNNGWIGGFIQLLIPRPVLLVPQVNRTLENIIIIGPEIIYEYSTVPLRAIGVYDDNCPMSLTNQVTWQVSPQGAGTIDPNGFLYVEDLDGIEEIIVTAEYFNGQAFQASKTIPVHTPRQLYVPTDYLTIQAALDAAVDTDEVILEDGVYRGDGNRDIEVPEKRITLKSLNGPESCIIDAEQHVGLILWPAFWDEQKIEGLTITHASPGIKFSASVTGGQPLTEFNNCIITNNNGSGIIRLYANLNNCIISDNAGWGINSGWGQIYNSTITGNEGGFSDCVVTVANSRICNNLECAFSNCNSGDAYNIDNLGRIENSIISGNFLGFENCDVSVVNSIIAGNNYGLFDGGDNMSFSNCVFYKNNLCAIQCMFTPLPTLDYCLFYGNGNDLYQEREDPQNNGQIEYRPFNGADEINTLPEAQGNIDRDPLFIAPGYWDDNGMPEYVEDYTWVEGDYHLKSEGWSWDTASQQWTWDDETSPCIDAGNPGMALGDEPTTLDVDPLNRWGENIRINMGAYGGTTEASMASPGWALLSDLDNSGSVNLTDFAPIAEAWLQSAQNLPPDVSRNGTVDLDDVALLAQDWLKTTTWH